MSDIGSLPTLPVETPSFEPDLGKQLAARLRQLFLGDGKASQRGRQAGRWAGAIVVFVVAAELLFHLTLGDFVDGIALGSLYGLIGVGIVVIYRTFRVINFAAGAVGAVPALAALMLVVLHHVNFLAAMPIALLGGPAVAAVVDVLIMRRFAKAPRLILTVVTIAAAEGLASLGFFIPVWMGLKANEIAAVPTPWQSLALHNGRGQPVLTGDQVAALVVTVALTGLLAAFLRYSKLGIGLRASSENGERASLLGIPVKRIGTIAWMFAGGFSAMAIYMQSPLIGVPQNVSLGFNTLLFGLAAAVVGGMESVGVTLVAAMGIGVVIFGAVSSTGNSDEAAALMLPAILVALLVRAAMARRASRAYQIEASSWDTLKMFRPIPTELRKLPEVTAGRIGVLGTATAVACVLPFVVGAPNLPDLVLLPIWGIVAVSLVILTGWGGQISLGQFGLVGAGAAAAGGLIADHNIDFFFALAIGIGAGAAMAVVIGLPALRIQGLYLAVTTLAFGYFIDDYVLNNNYPIGRVLLPTGYTANVVRPVLWQRVDLASTKAFYFVCVVALAVTMLAAYAFRRYRSGRVLIACRDNQRGVAAFAVGAVRARLAAFAISGGIAGMAGVLLVYAQHNVIQGAYTPQYGILVFLAAVIGGLTSLPWAVVGVVSFEALSLFGPRAATVLGQNFMTILPLLVAGPLLLVALWFSPGGSAQGGFDLRDRLLRAVAARRHLHVPSLVADRRVESVSSGVGERNVVAQTMAHVAALDGRAAAARLADAQAAERRASAERAAAEHALAELAVVACPVCSATMTVAEAAEHEHLRVAVKEKETAG
jgi:branched-chain amino acid transport system permease protein